MARLVSHFTRLALPVAALCLSACGGGDGTDASGTIATYTVGGTVVGLAGTLVLQVNGADDLSIPGSGPFAFSAAMPRGAGYMATVLAQPAGQTCSIDRGTGSLGATPVTDVLVTCAARAAAALATFAGDPGGAPGSAAGFSQPAGIATDQAGMVYIADQGNNTLLRITPDGVMTNLAGTAGVTGSADATGPAASFNVPTSIAIDPTGNLLVTDTANQLIRRITPAGTVTTLAGRVGLRGFSDGNGTSASFTLPYGAVTDRAGNLFVADSAFCTLRRITPAGDVTTPTGMALGARQDCTGSGGQLNGPFGLAIDLDGTLFVAHTPDQVIIRISSSYAVSELAGTPGLAGNVNGTGIGASFNSPLGIASDRTGNLYVADTLNHTVRRITPAGVVTTLAGVMGTAGFAPGALPGLLSHPRGLAIHGTTLYITVDNGVVRLTDLP
jgi:sugar lactone lactonase YvrE